MGDIWVVPLLHSVFDMKLCYQFNESNHTCYDHSLVKRNHQVSILYLVWDYQTQHISVKLQDPAELFAQ